MMRQEVLSFVEEKIPDRYEDVLSISVDFCDGSIWDTTDMDTTFVVVAKCESNNQIAPDKKIIALDDSNLESSVREVMSELDKRISVQKTDVELGSASINYDVRDITGQDDYHLPDIGYEIDSDLTAFRTVSRNHNQISSGLQNLISDITGTIGERYGDKVDIGDFSEIEFLFDDFSVCHLSTVRGYIVTGQPHLYYKDIDSVSEFLDKTDRDDSEPYEVFFRLDYGNGEINEDFIPDDIRSDAEALFNNRMSECIKVGGLATYEAEEMSFKLGQESTKFFLRQKV